MVCVAPNCLFVPRELQHVMTCLFVTERERKSAENEVTNGYMGTASLARHPCEYAHKYGIHRVFMQCWPYTIIFLENQLSGVHLQEQKKNGKCTNFLFCSELCHLVQILAPFPKWIRVILSVYYTWTNGFLREIYSTGIHLALHNSALSHFRFICLSRILLFLSNSSVGPSSSHAHASIIGP